MKNAERFCNLWRVSDGLEAFDIFESYITYSIIHDGAYLFHFNDGSVCYWENTRGVNENAFIATDYEEFTAIVVQNRNNLPRLFKLMRHEISRVENEQ